MRGILKLSCLAGLGLALGFASQAYILFIVGTTTSSDAFFASTVVPQLLLFVASSPLMSVLVPLLAHERDDVLSMELWKTTFLVAGVSAAVAAILGATCIVWVAWIFPGFSDETLTLTTDLTRIHLVMAALQSVATLGHVAAHIKKRFVYSEAAEVVGHGATLAALMCGLHASDVTTAAWIYLGRAIFMLLAVLPLLGGPRMPLRTGFLHRVWKGLHPLLAAGFCSKMTLLLDRWILSLAPTGALSLFSLAERLHGSSAEVLRRSAVLTTVPQLSQYAIQGRWADFVRLSRGRLRIVLLLSGGVALLWFALSRPLLAAAMGQGGLTTADLELFSLIIGCLSGILVFGAAAHMLVATYHALTNTRTPARIAMVGLAFSVPLKVAAFWKFGIPGLALAITLHQGINAFLLFLLQHRELRVLEKAEA